jgi:hypothetical protein
MPVTATMVFFPIEELSHSQPGHGPVRAEAEGEVIMVAPVAFKKKRRLRPPKPSPFFKVGIF